MLRSEFCCVVRVCCRKCGLCVVCGVSIIISFVGVCVSLCCVCVCVCVLLLTLVDSITLSSHACVYDIVRLDVLYFLITRCVCVCVCDELSLCMCVCVWGRGGCVYM